MIWARIVLKILVMTVVMIMVKIIVKMTTMMVMTRGSGDIRAHLRPKNETNGPRAVTVGGGSRVLHSVTQCVTICYTVFHCVTVCYSVLQFVYRASHSIFYSEIVCRTQWEEDLGR